MVPVLVCLLDGTLDGGSYSRWVDLKALTHGTAGEWSSSAVPLLRDSCSIALFVTIGLTLVCLHYQWQAMSEAPASLEESGVVRWHSGAARLEMRRHLDAYSQPATLRAFVATLLAVVVAMLLHSYYQWGSVWAALVPADVPSDARGALGAALYDHWWASDRYPLGAASFVVLCTAGALIVLALNASALNGVSALGVAQRNATFHVNWLNLDGCYGWSALRTVYACVYCSIALRAIQLSILLTVTGFREPYVVIPIASIWLAFIAGYVWVPYQRLNSYFEELRADRIAELEQEFKVSGQSLLHPTPETAAFHREVGRVRTASVNPLQLGGWQSWSFALIVLLPVLLTVIQVVAS